MKILFCAPFPVPVEDDSYSSGGDRKTSLTLRVLLELGHEVFLLNSSCTDATTPFYQAQWTTTQIDQQVIDLYNPPRFSQDRRIGKAIQALLAPTIGKSIVSEKEFDLVWIYNSYIFEARFALSLFKKKKIRIIFQIEDLPLARKRSSFNLKPKLDAYYFRELCDASTKILMVNSSITNAIPSEENKAKAVLFPPIIDPAISATASHQTVEKFKGEIVKIGYFGALTEEKGVGQLLRIIQKLPANYELNLYGKGELEGQINRLAANHSNIKYHGFISGKPMTDQLHSMDILLNPHADISKMQDGVFPFKMLEYIATGSYVITTPLPQLEGVDLSYLATYHYSDDALIDALINAPRKYSPTISAQLVEDVLKVASFESSRVKIALQLSALN